MQREVQAFERYLSARKLRLTPTRLQVLRAACGQRGPFGPEHVVESAMLAGQEVSRATVYRNLPHLEGARIVERVEREDQPLRWVLVRPIESGIGDLVCVGCGRTVDVSLEPVAKIAETICSRHGFLLTAAIDCLHGLCDRCRDVTVSQG